MWQKTRGGSERQAAVAVCVTIEAMTAEEGKDRLEEVGELPYVLPLDHGGRFELARKLGGLVLVDYQREVYWEKQLLPIDWFAESRPWTYLYELAKMAQLETALSNDAFLGGKTANLNSVKNIKCRLVKLVQKYDLGTRIKSSGKGEYRLDLPRSRIHIFTNTDGTKYVEVTPILTGHDTAPT